MQKVFNGLKKEKKKIKENDDPSFGAIVTQPQAEYDTRSIFWQE